MAQLPNEKNFYFRLVAVSTAALIVRVLPLLRPGDDWTLAGDSGTYLALAKGLRMGCGFAQAHGTCGAVEIFRTPGYPALLGLLPNLRSVIAVQALMGAAICLMLVAFMRPRWGSKAALAAGTLIALDVPSIQYSCLIGTDILFSLLLAAAVISQLWIISRGVLDDKAAMVALLAALLLGADALVRPVGQVLILAAPLPVVMVRPRSGRQQALVLLATLVISATLNLAWMVRNWVRAQLFTVSAEAGYQIYFDRAAESVWLHRGASLHAQEFFDAQDYLYDQLCLTQPGYCIPYVQKQDRAGHNRIGGSRDLISDSCQVSGRFNCSSYSYAAYRAMWGRGLHICIHDAAAVGLVTLASFAFMAVNPYDSSVYQLLGIKRVKTGSLNNRYLEALGTPRVGAVTLWTGALLAFIWAGVILCLWQLASRKRESDMRSLLYPLLLALALMAVSAGPLESLQLRFRVPSIPFLAMVAAVGWFGASVKCSRKG